MILIFMQFPRLISTGGKQPAFYFSVSGEPLAHTFVITHTTGLFTSEMQADVRNRLGPRDTKPSSENANEKIHSFIPSPEHNVPK